MEAVNFIQSYPHRTYQKGDPLVQLHDSADHIYAIRDGFVKVTALDDSGRQKLLWIAGRYDIVPIENLFSHGETRYFYTCFSETTVYVIPKNEFIKHATRNAAFMAQVARGLSEHHDDLLDRMNALEQSDVHSKLLFILNNLCEKFDTSPVVKLHELGLGLTHQDVADMIGATRETTSIELKRLRDEGLVDYSRSEFTIFYDKISELIKTPA